MSVFATFRKGGIHPDDKKSLSKDSKIQKLPMPDELIVSMSQHLGAPASLLKQKGDRVERGEKIGQASSFISADVHSPASGTISDVRKVTLANGVCCDAVVIQTDEVQPDIFTSKVDWTVLDKSQLLSIVKDKGIVGQGGATFPAHVKLTIPEGKTVETLIMNCVECEPYLTADYRLMLEYTDSIIEGLMICARITECKEIVIGVEANKMDAVELFKRRLKEKHLSIRVQPLQVKYPQGDEKQLIKAIMGREIPSGKLPLDVGAVVLNVTSVLSIYNAVLFGFPCIERVVTVSGECIANPSNFLVPVGTKVSYLIEKAGGFSCEPDKLISGGPMMGFAFYDEDSPITKGSGGIICIKDEDRRETECISCGRCVSACPMGLQPTKMYHLIRQGEYNEAMNNSLMDCKECGCCAYSCPANINLVHAFKMGKNMAKKLKEVKK